MEKNNIIERNKRNREIQKAVENKKAAEIQRKKQENERREAERAKLTQIFYKSISGNNDIINNAPKINNSRKEETWGLTQKQIEARILRQPSKKKKIIIVF